MAGSSNPWQYWLPSSTHGGGTFVQPINPWTLTINNVNSGAPATEAAVVARHSYGRQIGRISDLLYTLLTKCHADLLGEESGRAFIAMWQEVERVKAETATERLRQLAKDLASIKEEDPAEYLLLRNLLKSKL